jgi:glycosyltransferase involved in cell wall biosynthesis
MSVSIIIPNYNGEHLLQRNLPKVIAALEYYVKKYAENGEVIIVDDYSEDTSFKFIESVKLNSDTIRMRLLRNQVNMGF